MIYLNIGLLFNEVSKYNKENGAFSEILPTNVYK